MKIFITGGAGFLGTKLAEKHVTLKDNVSVFDITPLKMVKLPEKITYIEGDIVNFQNYTKYLKNIDVVYHCAAVVPISKSGKYFWRVNVDGTEKILQASLENKVKKFIYISTSAVYTPKKEILPITEKTPLKPLGTYGYSKRDAERKIQKYKKLGLDCTIIRPRTIIGGGRLGIFQILFEWINENKRIYILGKGDNLFQFLGINDLVDCLVLVSKRKCKNHDFNLGAEDYGTVRGDLGWLIKKVNSKTKIISINPWLAQSVLTFLDKTGLSPLADWHYKSPHEPFYFNTSKAKKILGWKPKESNKDLLLSTYKWYLSIDKKKLDYGKTHKSIQRQGILKLIKLLS